MSPVTEPSTTYSVTVPSSSSGTDRKASAAGVTPFFTQRFQGTQAELTVNPVPWPTSAPLLTGDEGPPHTGPVGPGSTLRA